MNRFFPLLAALLLLMFISTGNEASARSGKCSSGKRPQPKSGSCVGIPNCTHDQPKEDTASLNPGIRKIARCITKSHKMQMVSGFRCNAGTPNCNRKGYPYNGGAGCSQHLFGNAIDFRLDGATLETAQTLALQCGATNAVRYPCKKNNFLHTDTGRRRQWGTCGLAASIVSKNRLKNIFYKVPERRKKHSWMKEDR
jgi:hypothetical protein